MSRGSSFNTALPGAPAGIAAEYRQAMEQWVTHSAGQSGSLRDSSATVYEHMWSAFAAWAVGRRLALDKVRASDLDAYLQTRGGTSELSNSYALRLLQLIDNVIRHHARNHPSQDPPDHPRDHDCETGTAAIDLISARPEIRYANAAAARPEVDYLPASEARQLVTFLSAVRPRRGQIGGTWQEVRNRASVALMLGAGLTPGEVRALTVGDVLSGDGRRRDVPWKLRIQGDGSTNARDTPVAAWAVQLLRYWLGVRLEQGIPGDWLFPSTKSTGKRWGKMAQYGAAQEVMRAAGVARPDGGSFRLRHTFALRQLRRGQPPSEVAKWLGVTDPSVMQRYQRVLTRPLEVV